MSNSSGTSFISFIRIYLFGILLLGSLVFAGTLISCSSDGHNRRRGPGPVEAKPADQIITEMRIRLRLTPEQEFKIRPIIEEQVTKRNEIIRKYRNQGRTKVDAFEYELQMQRVSTENQLQYFLTNEQMIKYGIMQKEEDRRITAERPQDDEEIEKPRKGRGRRSGNP